MQEREIQRLRALLSSYTGVSAAGNSPVPAVQQQSGQFPPAMFDQVSVRPLDLLCNDRTLPWVLASDSQGLVTLSLSATYPHTMPQCSILSACVEG